MGGQTSRKAAKTARQAASRTTKAAVSRKTARESATAGGSNKPVLLSGGNPQIPKGDGNAPVQAFIEYSPGWKRDVGRWLDALIEGTVPNVRKAVRWNSPFYGVEGQGWFLQFHHFNRYVKLTFLNGTRLKPEPPVASKHPDVRYFHIHEGEQVDEKLLSDWVRQAASIPGAPLF